eukprot:TRINITY_DN8343_c0_g1_i1.p1 TRINITY_DN8343_c0_g1~~TRINITY_DN8343_c0_g1_i1.p1  ORF type:complete len:726 (+),score=103.54 TRINITY_DN8343_c0_g1_i1:57-2234(+)
MKVVLMVDSFYFKGEYWILFAFKYLEVTECVNTCFPLAAFTSNDEMSSDFIRDFMEQFFDFVVNHGGDFEFMTPLPEPCDVRYVTSSNWNAIPVIKKILDSLFLLYSDVEKPEVYGINPFGIFLGYAAQRFTVSEGNELPLSVLDTWPMEMMVLHFESESQNSALEIVAKQLLTQDMETNSELLYINRVDIADHAIDMCQSFLGAILMKSYEMSSLDHIELLLKNGLASGESFFRESKEIYRGSCATNLLTRSYLRCLRGLALCTYHSDRSNMDNVKNSIQYLKKILHYDPEDQMCVRYLLVYCYMQLEEIEKAIDLLRTFEYDQSVFYIFTLPLLFYKKEGSTRRAKQYMSQAISLYPDILEKIVTDRVLENDPVFLFTSDSTFVYVQNFAFHWKSESHSIQWAHRILKQYQSGYIYSSRTFGSAKVYLKNPSLGSISERKIKRLVSNLAGKERLDISLIDLQFSFENPLNLELFLQNGGREAILRFIDSINQLTDFDSLNFMRMMTSLTSLGKDRDLHFIVIPLVQCLIGNYQNFSPQLTTLVLSNILNLAQSTSFDYVEKIFKVNLHMIGIITECSLSGTKQVRTVALSLLSVITSRSSYRDRVWDYNGDLYREITITYGQGGDQTVQLLSLSILSNLFGGNKKIPVPPKVLLDFIEENLLLKDEFQNRHLNEQSCMLISNLSAHEILPTQKIIAWMVKLTCSLFPEVRYISDYTLRANQLL